jgi:polyhydroxybutyrate depolymerase
VIQKPAVRRCGGPGQGLAAARAPLGGHAILGVGRALLAAFLLWPEFAAAQAPPVVAPGDTERTIMVGGLERHYLLHIPPSYDGRAAVPVVLMFHGAGGKGGGALRETGWGEKADRAGFLAVFPDGVPPDPSSRASFSRNPQLWNDGSGRRMISRQNVDDVGFVRALLDDLHAHFTVDPRRVYVTGFSNGASMVFRLGAELADRVAAIAPVSGQSWVADPRPARPISVIMFAGTADPLNPLHGGPVQYPWGGGEVKAPMGDSVAAWAKALTCPPEPTATRPRGGVSVTTYTPCAEGSEIVYYIIEGMGHVWPGRLSALPERIAGKPTDKVQATDVIWAFFVRHARM